MMLRDIAILWNIMEFQDGRHGHTGDARAKGIQFRADRLLRPRLYEHLYPVRIDFESSSINLRIRYCMKNATLPSKR